MMIMPKLKFKNESTYKNYLEDSNEEEFDELFDKAVEEVKKSFGAQHPMFIAGKSVYARELLQERSPIDSATLGTFQKGTQENVQLAISEAKKAFKSWRATKYGERASIFRNAANLLSKRKFTMAAILSWENGKSRYESVGEVDEAIDFMNYYANELELN